MSRFRVVICGGGIAAVEGLLRLRRLVGDAFEITLVAPADELRYRPVAVQEPFSRPGVRRYPLRRIAQRTDAEWVQGGLEWLDPDEQLVHTAEGPLPALRRTAGCGRRPMSRGPYAHVTVFDDARPTRPTTASSRTSRAATRGASRCFSPTVRPGPCLSTSSP